VIIVYNLSFLRLVSASKHTRNRLFIFTVAKLAIRVSVYVLSRIYILIAWRPWHILIYRLICRDWKQWERFSKGESNSRATKGTNPMTLSLSTISIIFTCLIIAEPSPRSALSLQNHSQERLVKQRTFIGRYESHSSRDSSENDVMSKTKLPAPAAANSIPSYGRYISLNCYRACGILRSWCL